MMVSLPSSSASVIIQIISCAIAFFLGVVMKGLVGLEVVPYMVSSLGSSSRMLLACAGLSGQFLLI